MQISPIFNKPSIWHLCLLLCKFEFQFKLATLFLFPPKALVCGPFPLKALVCGPKQMWFSDEASIYLCNLCKESHLWALSICHANFPIYKISPFGFIFVKKKYHAYMLFVFFVVRCGNINSTISIFAIEEFNPMIQCYYIS